MANEIDMRQMARSIGANISFGAGSVVFNKGDFGNCMYIVQSGVIEMAIGDTVIETVGANEAIGFMTMVDGSPRSSTARVKDAELTIIDARAFRFMVDEVPNFAMYIMAVMARRIRGMSQVV
ncbi:MAG: Crp/Fnr family transcriptional regulator [Xanthobacteraceae bacterium]